MAINEDIIKILSDFGVNAKEDLQDSLRKKGIVFGGQDSRLSNSIKFSVQENSSSINFILKLADHYTYVDKGRKAGGVSSEGQKKISEWAKRKAIVGDFANKDFERRKLMQSKSKRKNLKPIKKLPFDKAVKSLTFLISRKIKAKGYEGTKFYSEVITDEKLEKLKSDLSKVIKKGIKVEVTRK